MIELAGIRTALETSLKDGGLTVYDHLPNQLHPPVVLIEPGDPYIDDSDTSIPGGHVEVAWTLHVITRQATPAKQTVELDDLIATTLEAIPDGWDVGPVQRPFSLTNGERSWLATTITTTTLARY